MAQRKGNPSRAALIIAHLKARYARLLAAYRQSRRSVIRLARANAELKRRYFLLKKHSSLQVTALLDRIERERYQLVFDEDRRLLSVSDSFLSTIGMDREEFARSFYVDQLFDKYLPQPDRSAASTDIPAFHFPVLVDQGGGDERHVHPFAHLSISGKASFDKERGRWLYRLSAEEKTSEVELNYFQRTDTLIDSLAISNMKLLKANKTIEMHKTMLISLICSLVGEYSAETARHLRFLQLITTCLSAECRRMGLISCEGYDPEEYVKDINYTSILHDIGKMAIPPGILEKDGSLTDEEMELVKRHPLIGAGYIRRIIDIFEDDPVYSSYVDFLRIPYAICRNHHERWDGTGYPDGLKGQAIPMPARIVCVADAYEAMRGRRSYNRTRRSHQEALDSIAAGAGSQFDPKVVEAFLNVDYRFADMV